MCECCMNEVAEWRVHFETRTGLGELTVDVCTDCLPVPDEGDECSVEPLEEVWV